MLCIYLASNSSLVEILTSSEWKIIDGNFLNYIENNFWDKKMD